MTYIPDARPKFDTNTFTGEVREPKAINPYWYKLIDGDDAEFLRGFDWCAAMAVRNFFYNEITYHIGENEEYVKYLKVIRKRLLRWVEGERDQLNCSMIESMDDKAHEERMKLAWKWEETPSQEWRECPLTDEEEEEANQIEEDMEDV